MSAHLETSPWFGRVMFGALLRGDNPPAELGKLNTMFRDPARRRAAVRPS